MNSHLFGKLNTGEDIHSYRLENDGVFAEILNYGATIKSFGASALPCRNIVGSFDCIEDYIADDSYQGALIGRVSNRIENGVFALDGKRYNLPINNGKNCLHGGIDGFNRKVWKVKEASESSITLYYRSEDGEEGFPSALDVYVTYTLRDSSLIISYKAIPEGKTPIALTNHSYFNLNGMGDTVMDHTVKILADEYSVLNENMIPIKHEPVDNTPFDLRTPRLLGEVFGTGFEGFDNNYIVDPKEYRDFNGKKLGLVATASVSDLTLEVYTNMDGMQFYTANFLGKGPHFSGDIPKVKHGALCFETQTEPNSVNRGIGIYEKGEIYTHTTAYRLITVNGGNV